MSLYHELIAILNLNHTVNQELKQHFVNFPLLISLDRMWDYLINYY